MQGITGLFHPLGKEKFFRSKAVGKKFLKKSRE